MDMQVDREQVRVAEYHLMLVNRVIERQSRLVADLEREGRDAAAARDLLDQCQPSSPISPTEIACAAAANRATAETDARYITTRPARFALPV
jgi:hypothetical protein